MLRQAFDLVVLFQALFCEEIEFFTLRLACNCGFEQLWRVNFSYGIAYLGGEQNAQRGSLKRASNRGRNEPYRMCGWVMCFAGVFICKRLVGRTWAEVNSAFLHWLEGFWLGESRSWMG